MDYRVEATKLLDYMTAIRREIHQHPELSLKEFETTDRIERELNKLGLTCKRFEPTGLMAEIKGEQPGRTVALRADIDALPMEEDTGLEFSSKNPGVMHSCGHDVHTAMLLGAAKILCENRDKIRGTVRLLFQPAEEIGLGALTIIDQGAAEGVDAFFGLHIREQHPVGTIAGRAGPQMAGAESFKMKVTGFAHHGGMPQIGGGVDAILIACEIVMAFQSIVSRRVNPLEAAVISVGTFHAGTTCNIIPGEVNMEGTLRYQSETTREMIKDRMFKLASGIAESHGAKAEIEWGQNISPVINDDWVASIAFQAAEKVTGSKKNVVTVQGTTGAEDFGAYSKCGKACFFTVGVEAKYPGHNPKLVVNENAMPYGCAMLVQTALDVLDAEEPQ